MNHKSLKNLATAASCVYALTMGASVAQAQVLSVNELYLRSGSTSLNGVVSSFDTVNSSYNLVSGYFGAGISQAPAGESLTYIDPTAIATSTLFGSPQNLYTAASNLGGVGGIGAGRAVGGPVPNGTVDTVVGTIAVNVSSFFVTWNGEDSNSAGSSSSGIATGTWNPLTGVYTMSISSTDVSGSTIYPRTWTFSGIATAVPEASTYGMFLAGLGCVVLLTRRRRFYS